MVIKRSLENLSRTIKTVLKQSGLGRLRPHDLRHTFASQLVMAGVDLKTIQELLGHSSYKTTEVYAHLAQDRLSDAISRLPY
jgi:site-specific recombinase XerD